MGFTHKQRTFTMSLLYTNNRDDDVVNMIAAEVHVGTQNVNSQMESYIYNRSRDGVYYLDLAKTWEKTMVAARIIAAIQAKNKKDVLVVSSREYAQRAVLKFATHTGANYLGGKWVPGTLTNQNTKKFLEPRLVIVCDPRMDHQALTEASYMNIPRDAAWDVIVDLFMFRNPDAKKEVEAAVDEDEEVEVEAEDAAVANTMKTFEGEKEDGDDEEEGEDEAWGQPATAGATYAQ